MTKTKEPAFVARTLRWCNARRKEKGKKALKKLPKGRRWDGLSCPCGKATGLFVTCRNYFAQADSDKAIGTVPSSVGAFVIAFDSRELPQYEAKA